MGIMDTRYPAYIVKTGRDGRLINQLRRLEPELTVHCPSLSELAAGDPRYPALLSALETALDSILGPLHLCGLSLGGVLAMDYALRHPERVASLVLCGTPLTMPRNLLRLR